MTESNKAPDTNAKNKANALGVWIAIGAGVGVAFGLIIDQLALGIAFGVGAGVVIGSILASRGNGRRADRQGPDA
jgi:hypothetical protein